MRTSALAVLATMFLAGCAESPAAPKAPTGPPVALSLGPGPNFAAVGSGFGLLVDAPTSISNVRCQSSNGDPVDVWFGFVDWNVYMWHATLSARTVGQTTVSCTADPNASGSTTVSIYEATDVTMAYVRTGVPGPSQMNPTAAGTLEINGNFRLSDGARQWPMSCSGSLLGWDPNTLTLTCSPSFGRGVPVNFLNAACVIDPAYKSPGFTEGSIYIRNTLLTTRWQGSKPGYQCMLFTIDSQGVVGPPK